MNRRIREWYGRLLLRIALLRLSGQIHYINGPETLPPPLTRQEEKTVMENILKQVPNAREPLITHNLRLVVRN